MKKAPQFLAGLAVLGVAVSGCGDDAGTGTNSGDLLETGEANAVFNQLFAIGFGGIASGPAPLTAPTAEPIPETSTQCPGGGSVTISGSVNGAATSATFEIMSFPFGVVLRSPPHLSHQFGPTRRQ